MCANEEDPMVERVCEGQTKVGLSMDVCVCERERVGVCVGV